MPETVLVQKSGSSAATAAIVAACVDLRVRKLVPQRLAQPGQHRRPVGVVQRRRLGQGEHVRQRQLTEVEPTPHGTRRGNDRRRRDQRRRPRRRAPARPCSGPDPAGCRRRRPASAGGGSSGDVDGRLSAVRIDPLARRPREAAHRQLRLREHRPALVSMYRPDTSVGRRREAASARTRHPRPPPRVPDARVRAAQAARHQARRVPGRDQLRLAVPDAAAAAGRPAGSPRAAEARRRPRARSRR